MRTVIGLFDDLREARRTASDLAGVGLRQDQISVVSPETGPISGPTDLKLDTRNVSDVGEIAACGPVMQYLSPSTAAGAPGVLVEALIRMGLPKEQAQRYVDGVKKGYTLETALVEDERADEALAIMKQHLGTPGLRTPERETRDTTTGTTPDEARIPIVEEKLEVGKREVEAGGVRVSTHVYSQPASEDVSLREERIDVERRAADRPAGAGDAEFREQTMDFVAKSEEPVVTKRARVVEEVVVRKDTGSRTETVQDTLRRTDVDVEPLGTNASAYEEHFRKTHGATGKDRFEDYAPAYRYGEDLRTGPASGKDWSNVEPVARSDWERKNPGSWERFKSAIRHAWERAKS